MIMKKAIVISFVAVVAIAIGAFFLWPRAEGVKQVNTTADNVAIKGFDTVAYFSNSDAVQGNPEFKFVWKGATWLFSSAANLDKFKSDPESFAPQFGGYCSWAVSHGYTADGDPTAWKIVDGKLYFNYNQQVKEKWEAEQNSLIGIGTTNWEQFKVKKPVKK